MCHSVKHLTVKATGSHVKFDLGAEFVGLWLPVWGDDASSTNKGAYMERGWMQQRLS